MRHGSDLVLLFDGTWNEADAVRPTNVCRTWHAVKQGVKTYYDPGVGTGRWDRFRGGAFGLGLQKNVEDAYAWLVEVWDPDDRIWALGYSRGAYTARSLAGLIGLCGIPSVPEWDRATRKRAADSRRVARQAMAVYRSGKQRMAVAEQLLGRHAPIRFVGVWDTVGALGVPEPLDWLSAGRHRFHDVSLGDHVEIACHALAIDEARRPFRPTLWRNAPGARQQLHQVWFPGVHSDVGGGRAVRGLSDIALNWMWQHIAAAGLSVHPREGDHPDPDPLAPIGVSRGGLYRVWPPFCRPVPHTGAAVQSLHPSCVERLDADPDWDPRLAAMLDAGAVAISARPLSVASRGAD